MADSKKRAAMLDDDDVAEKPGHDPMAIAGAKPKRRKSKKDDDDTKDVDGGGVTIHGQQLLSIIERAERLEEEKKATAEDIKDLMGEAKGNGYDPAVIKRILKVRKQNKEQVEAQDMIFDTYMRAIGGY